MKGEVPEEALAGAHEGRELGVIGTEDDLGNEAETSWQREMIWHSPILRR